MLPKLFLVSFCLIPIVVLLHQIHRHRQRLRQTVKSPFTDLLLRPAGESLRLKIREMEEKLNDHLFSALAFPLLLGACTFIILPPDAKVLPLLTGAVPILALAVGITYYFWGRKIPKLWREIRDYELGFQGERYVGEELNQLLKAGFRVFHDLPFNNFNIDHVLVGPPGVYAVETKTRRKPIADKGKSAHKVKFDGMALHFPWGQDTHGLEQAKRNADHLATWLSSATGEKVQVSPILTLPGWWVERSARGVVHVVNTKEIPKIFAGKPASLSPKQIQRIAHQIEQKCRNLAV